MFPKLRGLALILAAWLALAAPAAAQAPNAGSSLGPAPGAVSGFGGLSDLLPPPGAQLGPVEAQPVVEEISIRINGPQQISREAILAHVLVQEKMVYSQEMVDKSIISLTETGLFDHVQTSREALPGGGVRVVFSVFPKDRVSAVVFEGNKEYSKTRLADEIKTVAGGVLDPAQVKHDRDTLFAFYQKKGYSRVKVDYAVDKSESTGTAVVTFKVDEGPDVIIKHIDFAGNEHIDAGTLRDQMDTSEHTFFISWITGSGRFQEDKFLDDLDKLRQYYKKQGYLDVDIPDDEIEYKYPVPDELTIVIHVHEGRQYHIGAITVSGNTIFQSDTLKSQITLKPGDVFSPPAVDDNTEALRDFYGQSGYLETLVRPDRRANLQTGDIDLDFSILESEKYYVQGIDIQGNIKTKSTVIVRELALAPGDVFDTKRMKLSENRLRGLGYFNDPSGNPQVNLAPEQSNIPGKRNLSITVKDGKTGSVNVGAGFDTVQSVVAYVEWSQSNFDIFNYRNMFSGGGQKARIRFTIGNESNSIILSFEEPWLWQRELDGGFDLFRNETSYLSTTFNEVDLGFDVYVRKSLFSMVDPVDIVRKALLRVFDPVAASAFQEDVADVQGTITYTLENILITNVTASAPPQIVAEQGYTSVSKLGFDLQFNTTNDPVTPTEGSRYEILNEIAGGPLAGQTNFYRLEGRVGWWLPTFSFGNQVASLVGRAGSVNGYDGKTVPYAQKYFLGGGYNMRGYSFRNVGPRYTVPGSLAFGQPVGGNSFVYASPEYTIELFHPVRFAVFYDFGYVNRSAFNFDPHAYRHDVGIGFRVLLLGAPLRIDIGYPLNPDAFQSHSFQFNFSFGTVF